MNCNLEKSIKNRNPEHRSKYDRYGSYIKNSRWTGKELEDMSELEDQWKNPYA